MSGDAEITRDGVARELDAGNRVLLMVRHAERTHIDNDDPSFGTFLPITENGKRMSFDFGASFRRFADSVQFMASPLLRTRMTAEWIAKGMGVENPETVEDAMLGNSSPYFADQQAVFRLFRDGSFFERIFEYFKYGTQTGFAEIGAATERLENWCLSRFTARLGVFTTHDLYVCAFLRAKGAVAEFSRDNWARFLDSAAIVIGKDGSRRYALVRAGLSDDICGVDG